MFIHKIHLKNFRRFTDLTLDLSGAVPQPKLVLLIGTNGSGKTAIFDAFEWLRNEATLSDYLGYYKKVDDSPLDVKVEFSDGQQLRRVDNEMHSEIAQESIFYGRSALRQVTRLTHQGYFTPFNLAQDTDRPRYYIDYDERFEHDLKVVTFQIMAELFGENNLETHKLREQYLTPVNEAMNRICGSNSATSLALKALIPPQDDKVADILFTKGTSEIHYDFLSSGEKSIFNILMNFFNRRAHHTNTIYVMDELDVHLNTTLQYALLKEIIDNWLPENCQLWTASHSLGFIQYAQETTHSTILDFDDFDFDQPFTIMPKPADDIDVYEIAVPKEMLSVIFKNKQLFFCENTDVELYNLLGLEDKLFLPARDKNSVYYAVKNSSEYYGLMDRDYLTEREIAQIRETLPELFVLDLYAIENYLYHPLNIVELVPDFDQGGYKMDLQRQKTQRRDAILIGLKQTRNAYHVLTPAQRARSKSMQEIAQVLASDEFDEYYRYLDMKKSDLSFLAKYNLSKKRLAQTAWFQNAIKEILA